MRGETGERWRKLCEQAANEQDPQRLLELSQEIDRLLAEKEEGPPQQPLPREDSKKKGAA